jgi:type IV pilus assembly protein PilA
MSVTHHFLTKSLRMLTSSKTTNYHREDEGFTLIELLVAIVIIGTLSAIALPSYISQVSRARGSEAKSNIGAINRTQHAYRFEQKQFANDITYLDVTRISEFYTYVVSSSPTDSFASVTATTNGKELKGYGGATVQVGDVFTQIVCETNALSTSVSPNLTIGAISASASPSCDASDKIIQ